MAFPPAFTNVWDTTSPPDTQLANLFGQDLRNLRVDVMQRMSLLSGTFANRPTPENVNAIWGGAGFGLLYFSTDTGQVFQWNGGAWVEVTPQIRGALFKDSSLHVHTGTVSEDVIYAYNVNGNALGTTGVLRVTVKFLASPQGAPASIVRARFAGTPVAGSILPTQVPTNYAFEFTIGNRGLTNSQFISGELYGQSQLPLTSGQANAIDTTLNQALTITMQSGTNTDQQNFNQFIVELL